MVINGMASNWKPVTSGVPQGSVLGPLLFTLYVADIPKLTDCFISMFADDTKIYEAISDYCNEDSLSNILQRDLDKLQNWSKEMQMRFHPQKCKVMHLGRNNPQRPYHMMTEEGVPHKLAVATHEKDLGVEIDNQLKFSKHIQNQVNKANRALGAIKHTFKHIDKDTFLSLYKSLVRPHLEYASVIWTPQLKRDKDSIEQVQRRATRIIPSLSELPYSERLKSLNLPTLLFRRMRSDIIQMFKINKGLDQTRTDSECRICGRSMFKPTPSTNTRSHGQKYQIQHTSPQRKNFFPTRITGVWNNLKKETVECTTINSFKNRLAKEWKDHPDQFNYVFSY